MYCCMRTLYFSVYPDVRSEGQSTARIRAPRNTKLLVEVLWYFQIVDSYAVYNQRTASLSSIDSVQTFWIPRFRTFRHLVWTKRLKREYMSTSLPDCSHQNPQRTLLQSAQLSHFPPPRASGLKLGEIA